MPWLNGLNLAGVPASASTVGWFIIRSRSLFCGTLQSLGGVRLSAAIFAFLRRLPARQTSASDPLSLSMHLSWNPTGCKELMLHARIHCAAFRQGRLDSSLDLAFRRYSPRATLDD
jgi:hypothetical protein